MATKTKTKTKAEQPQQAVQQPVRAVTEDEMRTWIQVAAYYRAERRGFNGDPSEDWLAAEQEVQQQLVGTQARA